MARKTSQMTIAASKPFNEHRKGLYICAGNAGAAISVDTRRRSERARKGKGSYDRRKANTLYQ
ncbi:hypothetical protein GCM10019059_44710 [Camelimonas fluminis]|uniref:Uncharacterized protein n=1 Tax=Camelimonas fluminis TaxID=1576911 RepID=A0ABV7UIH6_9HYPH|nr:hypothetical protein [Camelimonas fluminis]GHE82005.1 hypothetical protein GCM10019059_44710 [Camelimonas fluminis]